MKSNFWDGVPKFQNKDLQQFFLQISCISSRIGYRSLNKLSFWTKHLGLSQKLFPSLSSPSIPSCQATPIWLKILDPVCNKGKIFLLQYKWYGELAMTQVIFYYSFYCVLTNVLSGLWKDLSSPHHHHDLSLHWHQE